MLNRLVLKGMTKIKSIESIKSYRETADYINTFINLERGQNPFTKRTYRLDRMEFLLRLFQNPEKSFTSIHIAGSKGKGSTAALFASVLQAAGFTVGLFTSPHILDIRERFQINSRRISIPLYISLLNSIKKTIDPLTTEEFPGEIKPTFFEIMTLVGFMAFREKKCHYCVIETGLGGRLDATNIVTPLVSILTPIELEHEDILGDTVEKITIEKCGIIKHRVPVFSSAQAPGVRGIIKKLADDKKAAVFFIDDEVQKLDASVMLGKTDVRLKLRSFPLIHFSLAFTGDFQAENAALVFYAIRRIFSSITRSQIKKGFTRAILPGRMEIARHHPLLIFDGAHTPGSILRICSVIRDLIPAPRILLFAAVNGKKYKEMAELLAPLFQWVIISTPGSFKKSNPREVYAIFQKFHPAVFLEENPSAALTKAYELATGTHPVFVTGSFYLIAEIKKAVREKDEPKD
jgi:dihydrofolate synthase/folylpolyglutamate synthase